MATFIFANNVETTLAGGISSASTSLTVSSTLNLPTSIPVGSYLVLTLNDQATRTNYEIVYVTAISGATLTVLRGQEGTSAKAWLTGDFAFSGPTAGQMANFFQTSASGVTPGTYGSSTQVPQFTVNSWGQVTAASNVAIAFPITSFNGRAGAIVLNSGDVTTALGYNPVNKAGDTMTGALGITTSGSSGSLVITDTGGNGANLRLVGNGATTPSKYIRAQGGVLQIMNDAYSAVIASLTDAGVWTNNGITVNGAANLNSTLAVSGNATFSGSSSTGVGISNASTSGAGIGITNTSSGGHNWAIISVGSAGIGSAPVGSLALLDNTAAAVRAWWDTNGNQNLVTSGSSGSLVITDTGGNGSNIKLTGNGSTTPSKWVRVVNGAFQIMSNAYGAIANLDDSGNLTLTGTINFSTSDKRVKTKLMDREPVPAHHHWYGDYDRTDNGLHGIGRIAQDIQQTHPHLVGTVDGMFLPDGVTPMLFLDRMGLIEEQSIYNGRRGDDHERRLIALEGRAAAAGV